MYALLEAQVAYGIEYLRVHVDTSDILVYNSFSYI